MAVLSVIIPVYNEKNTLLSLLGKVASLNLIGNISKEIIVVDDGSFDGTIEILNSLDKNKYKIIFHEKNSGKGAAIRTGLSAAGGEYVVIQDADLEYNPEDYNPMLQKMIGESLSVVYGSRELKKQQSRYSGVMFYLGGIFLTKLANLLFAQNLTDEATCYKMFRTDFLKSLPLRCKRFEFCPEVTALTALRGIKISEVGVDYFPRHKSEGKKIKLRDGWEAIWTLLKYRFKK